MSTVQKIELAAIAWLYLMGLFALHAVSADFSTSRRTWGTRMALLLWPGAVFVGLLGDLYDVARGRGRPFWMRLR
jgi:hypothetical protein